MNTEANKPKILVILTGGTICSALNEDGHLASDVEKVKIVETFKNGDSKYSHEVVGFDEEPSLDILSENMTVKTWNKLLDTIRTIKWEQYKGVIILHGTDTLAYMASLLSIVLAGIPVPVCLVSSQLPLDVDGTNGHANFRASVELIMNGIAPNVYAVYRNMDGVIYAHYGAHLLQCANYSDDFFSRDPMPIPNPENACLEGKAFETNSKYIDRMSDLSACVLRIVPHVGLDYNAFQLEGVRAIVHGTYHSQSVCVERSKGVGDYKECSILQLLDRCKESDIPVFLAPCSPDAAKYESTGDAVNHGASHIYGMTNEMAYVKTLVGCALGLEGQELKDFLDKSVNYESAWD